LLGVDEERKQIHCGLVDTIGSYTFAKTLEYKAKGLSGKEGKDITVIPPHEYQERFVSALESYFMACPGAFADARGWILFSLNGLNWILFR
jgi:1-phosphatidylinositol-3-phosphate 5-kinase